MIFVPISDENSTLRKPWITWFLILFCTVVFIWQLSLTPEQANLLITELGMTPNLLFQQAPVLESNRITPFWLTTVSCAFLHGSVWHLFSNMLFLWIFGDNIEDALGHLRFIGFYILCGFIGTMSHVFIFPESDIPLIGASGAVAGILGGYLVLYPTSRIRVVSWFIIFFKFIKIPAWLVLGIWIVGQFFSLSSSSGPPQHIAYVAHIGGFISGMILIFVFRKSVINPEKILSKTQAVTPISGYFARQRNSYFDKNKTRQKKIISKNQGWSNLFD